MRKFLKCHKNKWYPNTSCWSGDVHSMVMVRQIKLEAPDQNKLKEDFGEVLEGMRSQFVNRCDRRASDEA